MLKVSSNEFIISDITGRYNDLLGAEQYKALARSQSFEEFMTHLGRFTSRVVGNIKCKNDLAKHLYKEMQQEYSEIECLNIPEARLFFDMIRISEFFSNFYNELSLQKKPVSLKEAVNIYIAHTPLHKYFVDLPRSSNGGAPGQAAYCVMRNCLDAFGRSCASPGMRDIIAAECDYLTLEICVDGMAIPDKQALFPENCCLAGSILRRLSSVMSEEQIGKVVGLQKEDVMLWGLRRIASVCVGALRTFDDMACVYAYLKLRYLEMKNLLMLTALIELKDGSDPLQFIVC